jgi:hypothetical protein
MNITTQVSNLPLATVVNPPTDSLRRENNLKEMVAPAAAASQSAAEKGLASNKDKSRNTAQQNEHYDINLLRKQALLNQTTINSNAQDSDSNQEKSNQQETAPQTKQSNEAINDVADERKNKSAQAENHSENGNKSTDPKNLPPEAQEKVAELKKRDQEVRAHESAHAAVGGVATGAPSFTYEKGPDGQSYAVSGEVSVDLSPVSGNPQATIAKMQKIHAAALAPINPSSQDKRVAATATKAIASAQAELLKGEPAENSTIKVQKKEVFSGEEPQTNYSKQTDSLINREPTTTENFDHFINNTLKAQEHTVASRPAEIDQRALRIENFYNTISQAYYKPSNASVQLTA